MRMIARYKTQQQRPMQGYRTPASVSEFDRPEDANGKGMAKRQHRVVRILPAVRMHGVLQFRLDRRSHDTAGRNTHTPFTAAGKYYAGCYFEILSNAAFGSMSDR